MNINLTEKELLIINTIIEYIEDSPIGLESILGYPNIDDEIWNEIDILKSKINFKS